MTIRTSIIGAPTERAHPYIVHRLPGEAAYQAVERWKRCNGRRGYVLVR